MLIIGNVRYEMQLSYGVPWRQPRQLVASNKMVVAMAIKREVGKLYYKVVITK